MLARMTSRQFAEWLAYDRLEPLGPFRHEAALALLTSVLANCNRGKTSKVYSASDFLVKWGEEEGRQSEQEMIQALSPLG